MECISCEQHARLAELPPRDRIHLGAYWRLAHAWSALPGWLVIIARRHVVALAELTREEAIELGLILQQASTSLGAVTGCLKTYIMVFGEQAGFEHLHVHVVPRMPGFEAQHLGAGVFEFLKRPESEWVSVETRDQLALSIAHGFNPSCTSSGAAEQVGAGVGMIWSSRKTWL